MSETSTFSRMTEGDLSTYSTSEAEESLRLGFIHYYSENYTESIKLFEHALYNRPNLSADIHRNCYLWIGLNYMALDDLLKATFYFIMGTEIYHTDHRDFLALRDICLCKLGLSVSEYYKKNIK